MKRIFIFALILSFVYCTKNVSEEILTNQLITEKNISKIDILELEKKNPGIKIDVTKIDTKTNSKYQIQKLIDSLQSLIRKSFTSRGIVQVNRKSVINPNDFGLLWDGGGGCGPGDYTASVPSGGMFSSFQVSFTSGQSGISNFGMTLSGLAIGWTWSSGTNNPAGFSGCQNGSALYSLGPVSYTTVHHLNYHFEPGSCTFTYSWGSGLCGSAVEN